MRLFAAFLAGVGTGIAGFLFYLGKTMSTASGMTITAEAEVEIETEYDGERWRV
jgi:hypothetical protein